MFVKMTAAGTLIEVDHDPSLGILIMITPRERPRTRLALHPDVAEALTEGLMIETVRDPDAPTPHTHQEA